MFQISSKMFSSPTKDISLEYSYDHARSDCVGVIIDNHSDPLPHSLIYHDY